MRKCFRDVTSDRESKLRNLQHVKKEKGKLIYPVILIQSDIDVEKSRFRLLSLHARFFHRTNLVTQEIHLFVNANLILRYATHSCHSNMAHAFLHAARRQNASSHFGLLANCDLGVGYDPHNDRKATPSKQIAFLLDETSRLIAC